MKATKQLAEEHTAVKLMLKILKKIARRLTSQEKVSSKHLEQLVEFMQVFVDGCHHAKIENEQVGPGKHQQFHKMLTEMETIYLG